MENNIIDEKKYFWSMKEYLLQYPEKLHFVFYDRCSTPNQKKNLEARKKTMRKKFERHKLKFLGYYSEAKSGRSDRLSERKELLKAVRHAQENDVPLCVPSVNRLLRTASGRKDAPLTMADLRNLEKFLEENDIKGIDIVSIIFPGRPPEEVRSRLIKMGQTGKGNRGGRPKKTTPRELKKRRIEFKPIAVSLRWEKGMDVRKIPAAIEKKYEVKIPRATIGDWVKEKPSEIPDQENPSS